MKNPDHPGIFHVFSLPKAPSVVVIVVVVAVVAPGPGLGLLRRRRARGLRGHRRAVAPGGAGNGARGVGLFPWFSHEKWWCSKIFQSFCFSRDFVWFMMNFFWQMVIFQDVSLIFFSKNCDFFTCFALIDPKYVWFMMKYIWTMVIFSIVLHWFTLDMVIDPM